MKKQIGPFEKRGGNIEWPVGTQGDEAASILSIEFWGPRQSWPRTTLADHGQQELRIIGGLKDVINNFPLKSRATALERRVKGPFWKAAGQQPSQR